LANARHAATIVSAAAQERIVVSVRLFAILRERAGAERIELGLPVGATVADALRELDQSDALRGQLSVMRVALAVNREYANAATVLHTEDEIALIPPLSGGSDELDSASAAIARTKARDGLEATAVDGAAADVAGDADSARVHARVSEQPLDLAALSAAVADPGAGAIVIFEGVTRTVAELDYEAYVEMAAERMRAIAQGCSAGAGVRAIAVEHRIGAVPLGEPSVIVAVSAAHRSEAFVAARETIDRIKAEAPIWKQEVQADGAREWVAGTPAPNGGPAHDDRTDGSPTHDGLIHDDRTDGSPTHDSLIRDDRTDGSPTHDGLIHDDRAAGGLTHLGPDGRSRMVDVGGKHESERVAVARARLRMSPAAAAAVERGDGPKGEVLGVARIAGIQAGKQTGQLIPLAHPLPLTFVDVRASVDLERGVVELVSEARTVARTGVEMEAMTAASIAALTVYDMVKGLERDVQIEQVVLLSKRGGKSGHYTREED
jgi:molybdenum cofactor biosynthesis protein MoaC